MFEFSFQLSGFAPPRDHGYLVYSALSQDAPWLHLAENNALIGPIGGLGLAKDGKLLSGRSRLRIRVAEERVTDCLALMGKTLQMPTGPLHIGAMEVSQLKPIPALQARIVTIKGFTELDPFMAAARRQLDSLGIEGQLSVLRQPAGATAGEPWRRIIRIHQKSIVGYSLAITNLTPDESLTLQSRGLGGRAKMGCGFFVPLHK